MYLAYLLLLAPLLRAAPTTPNDAFRNVAAHAPKSPDEPVCCLRPLTPLEPVDEDLLLSFEEWKSRQLAGGAVPDFSAPPSGAYDAKSEAFTTLVSVAPIPTATESKLPAIPEPLSPHFRIPLTDRFNYASLDCSARVHTAHRGAKSAASILSSKKDRYMLSPCGARPQFVVVELCDDIWIDTVQLANYEFFSGVFKDFTVSVAKQYTAESSEWTIAGTYTGKNVRGTQSFHPLGTLRDFYRFMRIDFHSHYGSEYYCPISLLRVYGLTHLEQWKWELWENESRAKARALEEQEQAALADAAEAPQPVAAPVIADHEPTLTAAPPASTPTSTAPTSTIAAEPEETSRTFRHSTDIAREEPQSSPAAPESTPLEALPTINATDAAVTAEPTPSETSVRAVTETKTISLASAIVPAPLSASGTGENIYRTIMNRLAALEANTTLYARYVSSQTGAMHDALRRLHEELGRLETLGRAQAHAHARALADLERERRRLEAEQRALAQQAAALAHDVALERHLGVAQLCLLLAVLLFLALTRGAGAAPPLPPAAAVRAWGRRNLSLQPDWVQRLRTRSLTSAPAPAPAAGNKDAVPFPQANGSAGPALQRPRPRVEIQDVQAGHARRTLPLQLQLQMQHGAGAARPRTPSRRFAHTHVVRGPRTPATPVSAGARPGLVRSASHSSAGAPPPLIGPAPRSAKTWARSAHLHEVRPRERRLGADASARLNAGMDGGAYAVDKVVEEVLVKPGKVGVDREEYGEGWIDTDGSDDDATLRPDGSSAWSGKSL